MTESLEVTGKRKAGLRGRGFVEKVLSGIPVCVILLILGIQTGI